MLPIIKKFIEYIIASPYKNVLSQINVNIRGDIELRFSKEEDLLQFLEVFPKIEILECKISISRKLIGS